MWHAMSIGSANAFYRANDGKGPGLARSRRSQEGNQNFAPPSDALRDVVAEPGLVVRRRAEVVDLGLWRRGQFVEVQRIRDGSFF